MRLKRKHVPFLMWHEGRYLNATGHLYDEGPPGKWMQKLMAFVPAVTYTIVAMGEWQGEQCVQRVHRLQRFVCVTL